MEPADLLKTILDVVERKTGEWDSDGDAWLYHPSPDESHLLTGDLAYAIYDAIMKES